MNKDFVLFIVKKYLKFDKTQPFISVTALLAFFGVMIGVFVLIMAMAIMNGFDKEFERKLFTMNYPLTIYSKVAQHIDDSITPELRKKFPQIQFGSFIRSNAIIKSSGQMDGAVVFGVNFEDESKINPIFASSVKGKTFQPFECVIGSGLKKELDGANESKITLIFANSEPDGLESSPVIKRFLAQTSFHSGLIAYDKSYIYANAKDLAKVLRLDENMVDGIHAYSNNPMQDKQILQEALGENYAVVGWWQQNGNFFAALALEKRALFIVLMLIIVVASLNIISSLLMTVMSRRKEIALLLSLGASKKEIKTIFFYLGFIIGSGGILVGTILAMIGLYLLGNFDIISLPADVYGSSKLPLELSVIDFVLTLFGAITVVLVSSYYPAKKASEVDILTTLRNE